MFNNNIIYSKRYNERNAIDKIKFLETFYANVHHALIIPWSIYNLWNSSCPNAYPLIIFFDEECFI